MLADVYTIHGIKSAWREQGILLQCILDFELSSSHKLGSKYLSREVDCVRWFPAAFLANGAFMVTRAGLELVTPALRVLTLSHYTGNGVYTSK